MIEIDKTEVVGWEHAIRGMRNPLNSWDKSDSFKSCDDCTYADKVFEESCLTCTQSASIGDNDLDLMKRLSSSGNDHSKYLRMIVVYADINAPMYWWKEFDTYKVGTVRNSCSTMHKIHSKEFTRDDFSLEHLSEINEFMFSMILDLLNNERLDFQRTKSKKDWWQMIQMLPSSYNQKSTVMLNYQVLKNMYHSRKNHKLDEWHTFCEWVESLPHSELITG